MIQHNKECDNYLIKFHCKLVFNDNQYKRYIKSNLFDNKTIVSWQNFLEKLLDDFRNKGYKFKHIEEMSNVTTAKKMDMSYDLYLKHKLHAIEWKMNAMINKRKILVCLSNINWHHPLNRILESYRV